MAACGWPTTPKLNGLRADAVSNACLCAYSNILVVMRRVQRQSRKAKSEFKGFWKESSPLPRSLALDFGPLAKQVVVDARELNGGGVAGVVAIQLLNRKIKIEQDSPLRIFADHALNPEE